MSCPAILKNLYEPKIGLILTISFKITADIEITKHLFCVLPLQPRTCIGVLESIIMFFHSFIAMECSFTLFFTVNSSINVAGNHLAGGSFMEKA